MAVYITGLGAISAAGNNISEALRTLCEGGGTPTHPTFPTALKKPVNTVPLSNTALKQRLGLPADKHYSRTALLGMTAAQEALRDANLHHNTRRIGLISSTSVGGMDMTEQYYNTFRNNAAAGRLCMIAAHDCADSTEQIARLLHIDGFVSTVSTACSSAGNAIIAAAKRIEAGLMDICIAGGTDALCRFTLNGFGALMILDDNPTRPLDDKRAGLNLGEGAGYVVLQSEQSLGTRQPYCVLAGFGNTNDAFHQTACSPNGDGPYNAMYKALQSAAATPESVNYVNIHGTGTANNDLTESRALLRLFSDKVPPLASLKATLGHTLGASEGIEGALSVAAMNADILLPGKNFTKPIAETGLRPILQCKHQAINSVLSNAFGFGGNDVSLLFTKDKGTSEWPTCNLHHPIYITASASVHANGHSRAVEPDYKQWITDNRQRRRMSRLLKMAVTCGLQALQATQQPLQAIVTATGWGFLTDTEKFLNAIIDQAEQQLSPVPFIQSTFNTAGAQLAILTGNRCYNNTFVHRGEGFAAALTDALLQLHTPDDCALVGTFDEITDLSVALLRRMGLYRRHAPGEGAHFFVLSRKPTPDAVRLQDIETGSHISDTIQMQRAIKIFLQKNRLNDKDVNVVLNGTPWVLPHAIDFKTICGEYPSAVGFALYQACRFMQTHTQAQHILIANMFTKERYTLLLVSKAHNSRTTTKAPLSL